MFEMFFCVLNNLKTVKENIEICEGILLETEFVSELNKCLYVDANGKCMHHLFC